jgi:hypothetical protein
MSRRPSSASALRKSCGGVALLRATASQCFSSGCGGTKTSIWAVLGAPWASRIGGGRALQRTATPALLARQPLQSRALVSDAMRPAGRDYGIENS